MTSTPGIVRAVGIVFRHLRTRCGLTIAQVAAALPGQPTAQTVAAYERGVRTMSIARFVELCAVYQQPPQHVIAAAHDLTALPPTRPVTP